MTSHHKSDYAIVGTFEQIVQIFVYKHVTNATPNVERSLKIRIQNIKLGTANLSHKVGNVLGHQIVTNAFPEHIRYAVVRCGKI